MIWAAITDSHWLYFAIHPVITLAFALRVVWVRRPPGVAMAWILIVTLLPLIGLCLYFLIGERPIGRHRLRMIELAHPTMERITGLFDKRYPAIIQKIDPQFQPMSVLGEHHGGMPPMPGNCIALYSDTQVILQTLIADIKAAKQCCDLEFYIWNPGGLADQVAEALIQAAQRRIRCRILLDELGSDNFWKSAWPNKLRATGIELRCACAIRPLEMQFGRADLRLHRKIVLIDQCIAWTGSMNLVDPAYFKQDAGVGEWVDAMTRIEGPVSEGLATVFEGDWAIEASKIDGFGTYLDAVEQSAPTMCSGNAIAQVIPSGPSHLSTSVSHLLLSAILDARSEVVMTTPYFVPDDALFQALQTAACRGVQVTLIVPQRVDSKLVRYASRSYMGDLLSAGVKIQQFSGGLLHTKSLVVDRKFSIFGSVNLDMRSLRLNYEISLMIYDAAFSESLHALHDRYLAQSQPIDPVAWEQRPRRERLLENAAQILSPLL